MFYEGYSEECITGITSSAQVSRRIEEVTEKRLAELNLPDGPARDKMRSQIESGLRKEAHTLADGLVAKMDSVRFLRFFGVRLFSPLFWTPH